ncbi:immunoglobulin superfamily member 11-like isoform 2-T2 [Discoglossus pictus]
MGPSPNLIYAVRVTVNNPSVHVVRGGSALLPCAFRTTAALNRLNIIWTVSPLEEPRQPLQIISYEQGQVVESLSDYMGRVGFAFHPTTDASIFINQTRSSDTGTYQCTVINPPDGATPNIGVIGLTVLVPPSSPDCSSEGQGHEGGIIRLHCSVREGIPAPRFKWERIPPDGQMLLLSQQGDHHASVTLHNVSSGTSGLYRCTVTNQLGSRSCAVALNVHVATLGTMGIIVGITITLVMGLILLALFALVLCLHHQSQEKWRSQEDTCNHTRVDNLSPVRPNLMNSRDNLSPVRPKLMNSRDNLSPVRPNLVKSPCSDATVSSRITKPLWTVENQKGKPSSHIIYDVQRSQVSLSPVLESPNFISNTSMSSAEEDFSESGEEDQWSHHPTHVLKASLYPSNSGFLV